MYRGPSRGPCIGTIYPTLLGFGGIHPLFSPTLAAQQRRRLDRLPFACAPNSAMEVASDSMDRCGGGLGGVLCKLGGGGLHAARLHVGLHRGGAVSSLRHLPSTV